jgi:hypothetical protein
LGGGESGGGFRAGARGSGRARHRQNHGPVARRCSSADHGAGCRCAWRERPQDGTRAGRPCRSSHCRGRARLSAALARRVRAARKASRDPGRDRCRQGGPIAASARCDGWVGRTGGVRWSKAESQQGSVLRCAGPVLPPCGSTAGPPDSAPDKHNAGTRSRRSRAPACSSPSHSMPPDELRA